MWDVSAGETTITLAPECIDEEPLRHDVDTMSMQKPGSYIVAMQGCVTDPRR